VSLSTSDIILLKLDTGGKLLSSHCYGGSDDDYAVHFGDTSGSIRAYIIGDTYSNDGDLAGLNYHGLSDIVVYQLS